MIRRRLLPKAFVVVCALGLAGCGAATLPAVHTEQERIQIAHRMVKEHRYLAATDLLKSYIANNGGSADVDEAVYLLGVCYLDTHEFATAAVEFERLLADYPESDSSGAAAFRLGEAYSGQARGPDFDPEYSVKALTQWQNYLQSYPGHWLNNEARARVAKTRQQLATKYLNNGNLYFKLKLNGPAQMYYQKVASEYADTPQGPLGEIGLARVDAERHQWDAAIERLTRIEAAGLGTETTARARDERERIEHERRRIEHDHKKH